MVLALALHNVGAESLVIGGSAFEESSFQFTIMDSRGRAVPRTALGERVLTPPTIVYSNSTVELAPGKTLQYRFNLARLFDLSRTGEYTVRVSRIVRQSALSFPTSGEAPQVATLTAGPLKMRLVEAADVKSGPTALTHPPGHGTFFYITDENYSHWTSWTSEGKYITNASAVKCFRVGADGSVFSTLNVPVPVEKGSGAVAATPDGRFLYVGNENTMSQFRVGADGALFPLSPPMVPAQKFPGQLLMDPKGRFLYALSNWGNTLYAVGRDGRLTVKARVSAKAWFKDGKHNVVPADFGVMDSTGAFLYACNGGTLGYRLDAKGQVVAALGTQHAVEQKFTVSPTLGEQDTAISLAPSGRFAFVLAWKWIGPPDNPTGRYEDLVVPMRVCRDGNLDPLLEPQTPRAPDGKAYGCSSLAVDPTGHLLLVLNSQLDFIAPYRIGPAGSLTALKITQIDGGPAKILFVPGNPFVYVLNRYPPSLRAFRLDSQTGLTPAGADVPAYEIPFADSFAAANASTPPRRGMVSGGLQMAVRLPGDVLPADKLVILTVTLKNVTDRPIRLGTAGADMTAFRLTVAGPQRQSPGSLRDGGEPVAAAVPLLATGHDLLDMPGSSAVPVVLPPGGQRQYRFALSRLADLTVAGNYTVQITRTLPGGTEVASPVVPFLLDGPFNGRIRDGKYSVQIL